MPCYYWTALGLVYNGYGTHYRNPLLNMVLKSDELTQMMGGMRERVAGWWFDDSFRFRRFAVDVERWATSRALYYFLLSITSSSLANCCDYDDSLLVMSGRRQVVMLVTFSFQSSILSLSFPLFFRSSLTSSSTANRLSAVWHHIRPFVRIKGTVRTTNSGEQREGERESWTWAPRIDGAKTATNELNDEHERERITQRKQVFTFQVYT